VPLTQKHGDTRVLYASPRGIIADADDTVSQGDTSGKKAKEQAAHWYSLHGVTVYVYCKFTKDTPLLSVADLLLMSETPEVYRAFKAIHLARFFCDHRFCSRCAEALQHHTTIARADCPGCGKQVFPRISPAVIVAVHRDTKLLLARFKRYGTHKRYSLISGFVDPGETLEQCVQREVFEECGISVKSITYQCSQPWPRPDSLMVGFSAAYAGGQLRIQQEELVDANWFTKQSAPELPPVGTISRYLIEKIFAEL